MGRGGGFVSQWRLGWGIPDFNIMGMEAGIVKENLTGMRMGMAYPSPIRLIAIPTSKGYNNVVTKSNVALPNASLAK